VAIFTTLKQSNQQKLKTSLLQNWPAYSVWN